LNTNLKILTLKLLVYNSIIIIMERISVKSSELRSIGYDESRKILEIEFHHGGVYQYSGVSKKIYDNLMNSVSSHAQYYDRYIKNRYRRNKIL
jgi:hypothetical protein